MDGIWDWIGFRFEMRSFEKLVRGKFCTVVTDAEHVEKRKRERRKRRMHAYDKKEGGRHI